MKKEYTLLFIKRDKTKKRVYNIYQCGCGNLKSIREDHVKSGKVNSCGCHRQDSLSKNRINSKELPGDLGAFNHLLYTYAYKARIRGLNFSLTKDEFRNLIKQNCFYCNKPPLQEYSHSKNKPVFIYNGVDRYNNSIGYEIENCVPCCGRCNKMKMDVNGDEFIEEIKKIYLNLT